MARVLTYTDHNLEQFWEELGPKRRVQAMRGTMRKEANYVRKTAVGNLRSSGLRTDADLERGVRQVVFKNTLGFRVTVGTKGRKTRKNPNAKTYGYHKNRRGQEKPILIWAEDGTKERHTKHRGFLGGRLRAITNIGRRGYRGRMPHYAFMAKTRRETATSVTGGFSDAFRETVAKIALKYGCTV